MSEDFMQIHGPHPVPTRTRWRISGLLIVLGGAGVVAIVDYALYGSRLVGDLCYVYLFVVLPIGFLVIGYSVGRWHRLLVALAFLPAFWVVWVIADFLSSSGEPDAGVRWYFSLYGLPAIAIGFVPVVAVGWIFAPPRRKPGYCLKCSYNLRGLIEPRCPECGTPFDPESFDVR